MAKKKPGFAFEQSLAELEALVEKMESGELSLEQSLQAFEQGVTLTRECQQALTQAQQKVELLVEREQQLIREPFEPTDNE
ncbi:exodeoxyribonuclease VII small subunit [Aestuariirhabdus litorea]|uniref:Exodeoxyribonuclease 7 small subunit n=1 Tax=Aestuariirhabdus litorea TaxID=2528527 RepID=A0A3P3VNW0_9GAMM|nr:exodeoxyribonuclease VII small subunit [Aestuariirhabdus litorea]RRJ83608.1 exodeoxyribonuclease VII small subunit [Aestuariirhabdus litorea]RWW96829.1 exodeoxyribonuclease VII small subunit [Endozoicomonadaceae bacterium GTF-13]